MDGKIRIRIFDPRSLGSWCIKGTNGSTLGKDLSVPLMHYDPNDLGSKIRIRIFPKKRKSYQHFEERCIFDGYRIKEIGIKAACPLNPVKCKEMFIDFLHYKPHHPPPLQLSGSEIERVHTYKLLCVCY